MAPLQFNQDTFLSNRSVKKALFLIVFLAPLLFFLGPHSLTAYDEGYYADDDGFDSTNMSLVPGSLVVLYESTDRTTKKVSIEDITPSVDMFSISSSYISLDQQVTISDTLKLVVRYKYTNK